MLSVGELWTLNGPVLNSVISLVAAELGHIMSRLDGAMQRLLHPAQDIIRNGSGSLKAAAHHKVKHINNLLLQITMYSCLIIVIFRW